MRLFDRALEERIAVGFVFDRDVQAWGSELECADFATPIALCLFSAARNVQAAGYEPTLERVDARIVRDDLCRGTFKSQWLDRDAILDLLVEHQLYADEREVTDAVRELRAIRVRRDRVLALAERSAAEKRGADVAERERRSA